MVSSPHLTDIIFNSTKSKTTKTC